MRLVSEAYVALYQCVASATMSLCVLVCSVRVRDGSSRRAAEGLAVSSPLKAAGDHPTFTWSPTSDGTLSRPGLWH